MVVLITGNIKNFPDISPERVRQATRTVKGTNFGVWLGQEIQPGEDTGVILAELGKNYGVAHRKTTVPHFYDKRKVSLIGTKIKSVPMRPKLPMTYDPRQITTCLWQINKRPNLGLFATINFHGVPGAYNAKNPKAPDVSKRKRQWDIEFEALHNQIQLIRHQSIGGNLVPGVVFCGGDFNHPRPPKPAPNFMWLVGPRLDRLGCTTNGRILVDEIEDGEVPLPDHMGQWTRVRLSKA